MTKPCICCRKELPITAYYRHPRMADGHLNKCKKCVIAYQAQRLAERMASPEGRMAERVRGREKYHRLYKGKKPNNRAAPNAANRRYYRKTKGRGVKRAHTLVARALAACRLVKLPCQRCGEKRSEAHHPDYSKPLEVVWLCHPCHMKEHRKKD